MARPIGTVPATGLREPMPSAKKALEAWALTLAWLSMSWKISMGGVRELVTAEAGETDHKHDGQETGKKEVAHGAGVRAEKRKWRD